MWIPILTECVPHGAKSVSAFRNGSLQKHSQQNIGQDDEGEADEDVSASNESDRCRQDYERLFRGPDLATNKVSGMLIVFYFEALQSGPSVHRE